MVAISWGASGSEPVWNPNRFKYSGNTTCVEIESPRCIPPGWKVFIDGGTGLFQASQAFGDEIKEVVLLFTHYHPDHLDGIPISRLFHLPGLPITVFGPTDRRMAPKAMFRQRARRPLFPVALNDLPAQLNYVRLTRPEETALVLHATGGVTKVSTGYLRRIETSRQRLIRLSGQDVPLDDCLTITMVRASHPDRTLSYRFWERTTGEVFVFLTDHEHRGTASSLLLEHIAQADLLFADSQYLDKQYPWCVGFGHSTGPSCVDLAVNGKVRRLGLFHHSPYLTDAGLETVLTEAKQAAKAAGFKGEIFLCQDFGRYAVGGRT